jgi:hypothetical protein
MRTYSQSRVAVGIRLGKSESRRGKGGERKWREARRQNRLEDRMNETRYPLSWPAGWPRTPSAKRGRAQFGKHFTRFDSATNSTSYGGKQQLSIAAATERLDLELRRIGAQHDFLLSTNVPTRLDGLPRSDRAEPSDPGVAVYWKRKGKNQCMAIDRYDRVADNIGAVAATLEYLRGIERHGGGVILDRAFQGFAQLPAAIITAEPWRSVLDFASNANLTIEDVEERFRKLAHDRHADKGGNDDEMRRLIQARTEARRELGG